ncbi:Coiled-coil-helix-coiled-coil-helix domain-containing protein 8 [Echinococcus granulosus]|uniref:Coiled-coil-helix-coiled-coil-helix domain-containing protein 8 n=1 Tax=Echinococcus granulosus TaxID=6210 RepID=W6UQ33_ECHGR|nr:Coiled-coil-helix-coiled-coil-helix domain-containing protein 8 [Echinococcus granulosus]EUB63348.1 Coiled-coil-helix-coiled-coil-helix domain-containing protein 8 [Echinococcus granulosus]
MSGHVYKPVVPTDEDEDEDPVIKMIKHTGCLDEHNAIMECMFEHKDWRKCQDKVKLFRDYLSLHVKKHQLCIDHFNLKLKAENLVLSNKFTVYLFPNFQTSFFLIA